MMNNLAASLWHKMTALHHPEALLLTMQKHLFDFFWGGKHWVKPEVLSLPLAEGDHGLIDIVSRLMAFRVKTPLLYFYLHHCHDGPLPTP